jgi:ribonuclease P protein component
VTELPRPGGRRAQRGRLSRSADFERVYRQGRSHGNRYLVLHAFPRSDSGSGDEQGPRLGLSVSRKVGGAVVRNRVKRLAREAFELERAALPEGSDVVIVARPDARDLAEREGLSGFRRELAELVAKAAAEQTGA